MDTLTAIRSRRSVKSFDGTPIPRATLDQLCELVSWAPTHRMTQPWRCAVLDQPAIARLSRYMQETAEISAVPDPTKGAAKMAKLVEKLPTLGALILVTWVRAPDSLINLEEHAAASAAVQNLLLGATALGLGSFWSSNPALSHPLTLTWCGCDPTREGFLGAIWLGTSFDIPPAPTRLPLTSFVKYC